jgi:hypothetical protein
LQGENHHESRFFRSLLETRPGISDENREFADTVVFSVFAAFVDTCAAFTKQMEFGFEDDLREISERIRKQFAQ